MRIKFLAFAIVLFFISCADESLGPVATFDIAGKGAYVRLVSENERFVNLFDVQGANYVYSVELVDLEQGALISSYDLKLTYDDNDPSNGNNSKGPIDFKSFSASDFEDLPSGFKGLSNISVKATEMLTALGLTEADVSAGDVFEVDGFLTLDDGRVFGAANSTAAVNGSAFQGHFSFNLVAGCPSDLDGTYNFETTDVWCNGSTVTGTVDIIQTSAGTYVFSDWSFGAYGACYGAGSVADSGSLTFGDVCAVVSFTGFVDVFGDTWTYQPSTVNGDEWLITWDNTYGESGTSTIFNNGGPWPFTLAN
ncbi:MAG: hypothetical protein HKN09_05425 [Saprospiraceae bacterium]|nr:hypothetical protein [Saprospiraceae bacterium]